MDIRLIVEAGPDAGQELRLRRGTVTLGRSPNNSLVLSDVQVSRWHAEIRWQDGVFVIQDLGSRNGTFVNEGRLTDPQVLRPGDRVRLGDTHLVVQEEQKPVRPSDWIRRGRRGYRAWEQIQEERERAERVSRERQPRAERPQGPRPVQPLGGASPFLTTGVTLPLLIAAGVTVLVISLAVVVGRSREPVVTPALIPTPTSEIILGTGDVQVTLRWNNTADIDLHVMDPFEEEIYYRQPMSESGGELDVDANGDCIELTTNPVENIFWPYGQAPVGRYRVFVVFYSECNDEGLTAWQVTVKVDDQTSEFSGTIIPEEEQVDVTTFER
jgi:hypothetical protein